MKTLNELKSAVNVNAFGILAEIAKGFKVRVDVKDPSVRANIGVLLRKGLIIKTQCAGGVGSRYDAVEDVRALFLKPQKQQKPQASSVKKVAKKKSQAKFIARQAIIEAANVLLEKLDAWDINIRSERDYNMNKEYSIDVQGIRQIEVRSSGKIRVVCNNQQAEKFEKFSSMEIKKSKSGKLNFIDCEISPAAMALIIRIIKG